MEPGLGKGCAGASLKPSFMRILLAFVCLLATQIGAVPALGQPRFEPAHFDRDAISVFPDGGKKFSIRMPPNLPPTINLIGFALGGRAVYLQEPSAAILHDSDELIQVDLSPLRQFPVRGSGGLGDVYSITTSPSGSLLVGASGGAGPCGAFEIDTSHATRRSIMTEPVRPCTVGVEQVEPDGKRVLIGDNLNFRVINVLTGAIEFRGAGRGAWSTDGNWLAISKKGEIAVFDGRTFSLRRHFRASSVDGHLVWSPDSKRILFAQQELRCFPMEGDLESLAVLDVEAGKKWVISSSHCMVTNSRVGWVDAGVLTAYAGKN